MCNSSLRSNFFEGNFTCHVENEAGSNEYTYEIIIYLPPIEVNANQTHTIDVIPTTNISLDCPANGIPPPKV